MCVSVRGRGCTQWANDPNYKVNGFEASKWSEWADLLTFDHIMDNYDRSRDYALWKNVHWEKKGDTARSELQNVAQNTLKEIIPVPKPTLRVKARKITKDRSMYA